MTEEPVQSAAGTTAGAMLREARERQGIHLAVLAAAIKISTRKLDALETDRYSELPDPAFTRALAQTVARALKLDPQPVLALLPPATPSARLESVSEGLNTPFKDKTSPTELSALLPKAPLVWAGLALFAAAALLLYWPYRPSATASSSAVISPAPMPAPNAVPPASGDLRSGAPAPASPPAAGPATTPDALGSANAVTGAPVSQPPGVSTVDPALTQAGTGSVASAAADGVSIVVSEPVWLEVIDGAGSVVFMRTLQPGETLNFDERLPLRMKLGNAPAAKVTFRGETVDLGPLTRGTVARVVLK